MIQNKGSFIISSINEVKQTALIGILFAILVLFIFLRRIGTTAIISIAIPISIIATFNLMYFKGLTLNIMTLGGLALGAGMLVDNAIIVMENIFRNLESGLSLKEASVLGTSQVSGAIIASTITTIVVFLPIVYLHGTAGELFREQAWTVAFSLLSSLIVAILVIPMLSSKILSSTQRKVSAAPHVEHSVRYKRFLRSILKHPWLVVIAGIAVTVGGWNLIPHVGNEFMPSADLRDYAIEMQLPEGTELYRTDSAVKTVERNIREIFGNDIASLYSVVGSVQDLGVDENSLLNDENTATIKLSLTEASLLTSGVVFAGINEILASVPDLEARIIHEQSDLDITIGTETAPIIVEVHGEELDEIAKLTDQVGERLAAVEGLYNIEVTSKDGLPEIDILFDRTRASMFNVGLDQLSSQLRTQLIETDAGEWDHSGETRSIVIKLPEIGIRQLEDIRISSGDSEVSLYEVADISTSRAPTEISRKNQVRIGTVTAHMLDTRPLDKVVSDIHSTLDDIVFPPDYEYEISGDEQKRQESFVSLRFALLLSLALVYMVLASQFESLMHPFTIILSIPLAGVGAVLIFFILGRSFNIMAYIGIIMLAGIAVNDSIILVDAINQLKRDGMGLIDAIVEAGGRRLRPIIMTSLTTILALLPLTFGIGEGAQLRSPMALAVIGGLVSSTIMTLIVIPCVFSLFDRFSSLITGKAK